MQEGPVRLFAMAGIWPESKSFSDEGLGPVPARWKGVCQSGESFSSSSCNRSAITRARADRCNFFSPRKVVIRHPLDVHLTSLSAHVSR